MYCDNKSPPGAWRQEILRNSPSREQLLDMVWELQHCLDVARKEVQLLETAKSQLASELRDSNIALRECELRYERMNRSLRNAIKVLEGLPQ